MVDQKWLEACIQAGEFLYGIFPAALLKKMYERKRGYKISDEELKESVESSTSILMEYVEGVLLDTGKFGNTEGFLYPVQAEGGRLRQMLKQAEKEGNPYAAIHLNEEEHIHLLDQQEGKDFYVPTEKEITELVELGYIRTPAMTALEVHVKSLGGDPSFVTAMWPLVSAEKLDVLESVHYAMDHAFPDSGAPSMEAVQSMLKFIQDYLNSIKLRTNRGWDPAALRKKVGPTPKGPLRIVPGSVQMAKMLKEAEPDLKRMGMQVNANAGIDDYVTVGDYGERRVIKVGRNDPCPCGSGKKYKKCCGKIKLI